MNFVSIIFVDGTENRGPRRLFVAKGFSRLQQSQLYLDGKHRKHTIKFFRVLQTEDGFDIFIVTPFVRIKASTLQVALLNAVHVGTYYFLFSTVIPSIVLSLQSVYIALKSQNVYLLSPQILSLDFFQPLYLQRANMKCGR